MNRFFSARDSRGLLAVSAAVVAFALTSCASPPADKDASPPAGKDAIARTLTQLDDDWSRAAATGNADSVAAYYAEDAIAYPPDAAVAVGRAAAQRVWASYFADSTFTISWKTEHAGASSSGDLGFTSGTYEDSFKRPDGTLVEEKGKYLCVWEKQPDGSWKAVHDMWNTDARY
jgi:ketosteroid isomerase-like protein